MPTIVWIIIAGVVLVLGLLWATGRLGSAKNAAQVGIDRGLDKVSSQADRAVQHERDTLKGLLAKKAQFEDQIDTFDGKVTTAAQEATRLKGVMDEAERQVRVVATAGNQAATTEKALAYSKAKTNYEGQVATVATLKGQSQQLHDALQATIDQLEKRQSELSSDERDALRASATKLSNGILEQNKQIAEAASLPNSDHTAIADLLNKEQAKAARLGPSEADKIVREHDKAAAAADVLASLGLGPKPDATPPAGDTPKA